MGARHLPLDDDFDGDVLDTDVWVPHYLPHWSSRADSSAAYDVADSTLRLTIPTDQGLWCEGTHDGPLRVSGVQSGEFAGPSGSAIGQQPFVDGLRVHEEQPTVRGWLPQYGRIDVRARMSLSARSMASVWLIGFEDRPERCGEICLFEVFGDTVSPTHADVGTGVHAFRDPALVEEFSAELMTIDVTTFHDYAVDWRVDGVEFLVDGQTVRQSRQSPPYEMQMMIAVFDFPDRSTPDTEHHVPEFVVDHVRYRP